MSEIDNNVETDAGPATNGKRKKAALAAVAIVAIIGIIFVIRWQYDIRTSINTDNAKVAGDIVDISAKISGHIQAIQVKEGDPVKTGQALVTLDNTQLKLTMDQSQANLDIAKANYEKLPEDLKSAQASVSKAEDGLAAAQASADSSQLGLNDAERSLYENEKLFKAGAISQDAMDSSQFEYSTAQAKLEIDKANARVAQGALQDAEAKNVSARNTTESLYIAQLKQAQAAYDIAKYNYDNSVITAPTDGIVVRVVLQNGENITAGQAILSVCDLGNTWITANIDEDKIGRVKAGQEVDIKINGYPGLIIPGKVITVGGAAQSVFDLIPSENTSGNYTKVTQRLSVKIWPDNRSVVFKPGMSAYIKIHTAG